MSHHLLIASRYAAEYQRLLAEAALPGLTMETMNPDQVVSVNDTLPHDLFFGEPNLLRQLLRRLPCLTWAQVTWAGVEPLLDPSLPRSYTLTNARGVFGSLMVEYVFGYLLAHERRILSRYEAQQAGRWDTTTPGTLRGKTMGLLGVGSIGAHLAQVANTFGLRLRGYTRTSESCSYVHEYFHPPQRLAFAAGLDYLVSVLPNTPATRHLVDTNLLASLPPHAVFINAGRGNTVDENALAAALNGGRLALAVLDVFEQEPLPAGHVFWHTPNLFITSHTAALTHPPDLVLLFCENYQRLLRNEPLLYPVNFDLGY